MLMETAHSIALKDVELLVGVEVTYVDVIFKYLRFRTESRSSMD